MLSKLVDYLKSPSDNDPAFIRLVQNLLVLTLLATIAAIFSSSGILTNNPNMLILVTLTITALLEAVSLFSVTYRKNVQMGKYIVPGALVIAVTVIAINGNGMHDLSIVAYPVIIILAFLLQGDKAMALTIPLVSAAFIILAASDILGYTQSPISDRTGVDDVALALTITLAAGVSLRLLVNRLNDSLRQAKENEIAQQKVNQELRDLQATLEQRIQERTAELAASARQIEKRARQLESIAEISQSIAQIQSAEALLPQIAHIISKTLNYYHVGIFLLDENHEYAVLQAANSEGGQRMLARQHKLRVESSSLVGYAAIQKQARIALDVGDDAVFFNNPDLPNTRSEIALPMLIGDQVIGVLDVQSTEPNAFAPEDIQTLSALANQVAVAIENARLLSESRAAASTAENIYRQFVAQGWQKTVRTTQAGYRLSEKGIDPLSQPLNTSEVKQAAQQGDLVIAEEKKRAVLAVPIKVRDQVIGVLNIRSQKPGYRWDEEELTLVRALADRVALALENARLLADAQRRAAKERVIGEISDKISSAGNIESILQVALKELSTTINAAKLSIELEAPKTNLPDQD